MSDFSIRPALPDDLVAIYSSDPVAEREETRREFIARSVASEGCFVATVDDKVVGYCLMDYAFYSTGFISLLYVHREYRRLGIGANLMRQVETICRTSKLFTSTNLSNLPMQSLLAKLNYELCGVIHHLDEGDPELVYVKFLKRAD